ncbi:MAG: hypothetical protein AAF738_02545 [Bacteroidota bacterium]
MKNIVLVVVGMLFLAGQTFAQGYDSAVGIRLGTEMGLTYQQRIAKRITVEGILQTGLRQDETTLTLLGERHYPLGPRNINVYLGGGLHKGWVNVKEDEPAPYDNPFGITGIAGAEISIGRINLSYDFKPAVNIVGGEKALYTQTAVSARYIIDKRKIFNKKSDKQKERAKTKRQKQRAKKRGDKKINWKFWENF